MEPLSINQKYPPPISQFTRTSTLKAKLIYSIYLLLGVGFSFMALYTLLKTVSYIGMVLPPVTFLILGAFIISQGVLAYGFLYMKKWIISIVTLMIVTDILLLAFLYSISYTSQVTFLLTQIALLLPAISFFLVTRNKLTGGYFDILPVSLYTISMVLTTVFGLLNLLKDNLIN